MTLTVLNPATEEPIAELEQAGVEEADLFAVHQDGGQTIVEVFFFRMGQNWGNRAYFPRADKSLTAEEVLGPFIVQFYEDKPVPREIMLSHALAEAELMEAALTESAGHKVEILVPKRGARRDLVEHALANAREALGRRLAESSSQKALLEALAGTFGLTDTRADWTAHEVAVLDDGDAMVRVTAVP